MFLSIGVVRIKFKKILDRPRIFIEKLVKINFSAKENIRVLFRAAQPREFPW